MDTLILRAFLNSDIYARLVLFRYNVNIGRRISAGHLSVGADIICSCRYSMQIGHLFQ